MKKFGLMIIAVLTLNSVVFGQYFSGAGGSGSSLAVLVPEGKNLSATEKYLPAMVQGILSSNLTRFSAMSVLDRQSLDKVLEETESGAYAKGNYAELGKIANMQYFLSGQLAKTSGSAFSLQLKITEAETGLSKATYTASTTLGDLTNAVAINRASLELLKQMGVELTPRGEEDLNALPAATLNAEVALAKAITAPTVVETLSYLYKANNADSSLTEVSRRLASLSTRVSSGNIGADARNDIAARNAWKKVLDDAGEYFYSKESLIDIVMNPNLTNVKTDYQKETVDLAFKVLAQPSDAFGVLDSIFNGLYATGKKVTWGLQNWPLCRYNERNEGNARWQDTLYVLAEPPAKFIEVSANHFANRNTFTRFTPIPPPNLSRRSLIKTLIQMLNLFYPTT